MASRLARSAVGMCEPADEILMPLTPPVPPLTRNHRRRPCPPIASSPRIHALHRRPSPLQLELAPGGPQEKGRVCPASRARAWNQSAHQGRRPLCRCRSQHCGH
ncbi:predicted protein [Plenodomus lingam JN3]|uniref:Predicted protein n=1 Tax=Leptosphaeria maculans (strain JN3 / isolate v23.1.3 / race Av1-4-5-6-7-8) TaxID=985895 RepID=E4ZX90_LEPMJ|nr:predicted protein [Plenodomus lingam JN3]CBX95300.1 predicted protein [Plenodomus lingam JN3]